MAKPKGEPKTQASGFQIVAAEVPPAMREQIRSVAAISRTSMSEVIREAVGAFLSLDPHTGRLLD